MCTLLLYISLTSMYDCHLSCSTDYVLILFSPLRSVSHLYLHSFPTRRSSDLAIRIVGGPAVGADEARQSEDPLQCLDRRRSRRDERARPDRKSTRLNSSHLVISYAVFCLKKKMTES